MLDWNWIKKFDQKNMTNATKIAIIEELLQEDLHFTDAAIPCTYKCAKPSPVHVPYLIQPAYG